MPPKKQQEPSKKTVKKEKEKLIEDKTFGLKNKNKSAKVQNYVKSVQANVLHGQQRGGEQKMIAEQYAKKKEAKKKEEANNLLASLFKNAQNLKGMKNPLELKAEQQINLYYDPRQGTTDMPEDTIITCKHFLDAVEDDKYGWRWECPNKGKKCEYRHMLPAGYVVTSKKERERIKKEKEAAGIDERTLEEIIEAERAALPNEGLTPVTKESFFAWKERRAKEKQEALEAKMKEHEVTKAKSRATKQKGGIMNGRALFTYNPELFKTEYDDAPDEPKEEESKQIQEAKVDDELFAGEAGEEDEDVDFD